MIDSIGGEILSTYCTCTAWLYGSCNHVTGLLFRVKADVLTGLSKPTYTSISPACNFPSTKKTDNTQQNFEIYFYKWNLSERKQHKSHKNQGKKEQKEARLNFRVMTNINRKHYKIIKM